MLSRRNSKSGGEQPLDGSAHREQRGRFHEQRGQADVARVDIDVAGRPPQRTLGPAAPCQPRQGVPTTDVSLFGILRCAERACCKWKAGSANSTKRPSRSVVIILGLRITFDPLETRISAIQLSDRRCPISPLGHSGLVGPTVSQ
jgi:hypothetical protein